MRGMLILVLALATLPGCQQKWTGDRLTMTTYHSFNDVPNQGWRVFAIRGDYSQAANLLSRYIDANQPILQDWQIATLRFHQGQMLGCQGKYQLALQMLAEAKAGNLPTTGPAVLGLYVNATIAFMEQNRSDLKAAHMAISAAEQSPANQILREKVAVLQGRFNGSYRDAWIAASKIRIPIGGVVEEDMPASDG